ncbi:Glutamate receptor U1-like 7, partial [Homarus americanus]
MPNHHCSVFLLTDGRASANAIFKVIEQIRASGVGLFKVDGQDAMIKQTQFSQVIYEARRLRQVSWCVTVVVVSDDPAFLAAFAEWSLKGRLLVWPTRLLVVTRLPLPELHHLHKLLSMTNSMLLILEKDQGNISIPFIHNTINIPFVRFLLRPNLVVATERNPINKITSFNDGEGGKGQRFKVTGPMNMLVDYLAKAHNFSYTYMRPPDGSWGHLNENGSWSGMVGMVVRKEADLASGPFGLNENRAKAIDYTAPVLVEDNRLLGARGKPTVDPWGFLLPLAPWVWVAILTALHALPVIKILLDSCFFKISNGQERWLKDTSAYLRILLQQ